MKMQVMSDIHLQFWARSGNVEDFLAEVRTEAEVLVLAGDAVELTGRFRAHTKEIFKAFCQQWPIVVYVPGNHEFYDTSIDDGLYDLFGIEKELQEEGHDFRVLHTGRVTDIDGRRFLGATMWQPHPKPGEPSRSISDHYCIVNFHNEAKRQFAEFEAFLKKELRAGDIVVTHHTPSYQSCAEEFQGYQSNRWFHTPEVEPLILERKPSIWIHGHTHSPFDYQLGTTRIICNPRGYPGEDVDFNPKLLVDLTP